MKIETKQRVWPTAPKPIFMGIAIAVAATMQNSSFAQSQGRGQIVEGLFRTLLDAHMERERRSRVEQQQRQREAPRRARRDRLSKVVVDNCRTDCVAKCIHRRAESVEKPVDGQNHAN